MATESDLRDLLRDPDPEGRGAIDLDAVLSRARRRRRPKVIAAQALGSVAAVGVLVTGVAVTLPQTTPASLMVAEDAAGGEEFASSPESADQSALRMASEVCGQQFDASTNSTLAASIDPLDTATTSELRVPVTVTNSTDDTLVGLVSLPRIVITRDGVVVGHASPLEDIGVPVTLAPAEGSTLDGVVEPYACDPGSPDASAAELELLAPGNYEMRPVVQFVPEGDVVAIERVVGDAVELTIR